MNSELDYTKYTLEELIDARNHIDETNHPERVKQLDLLIKDRIRKKENDRVQRVSIADDDGNIASVKGGRAPSLGRGLSELVGGVLFGIIWINQVSQSEDAPYLFIYIGYFVIVSAIIGGGYHIYNAFAKNRFTEHDIVAPGKERDPFASALGLEGDVNANNESSVRKFSGDYCPYCRARVENNFDFCPSCGKDI